MIFVCKKRERERESERERERERERIIIKIYVFEMIKIGNKCDFLTYIHVYVTDMYWAILFWYLNAHVTVSPYNLFSVSEEKKLNRKTACDPLL